MCTPNYANSFGVVKGKDVEYHSHKSKAFRDGLDFASAQFNKQQKTFVKIQKLFWYLHKEFSSLLSSLAM
jgi:hypothetical protein